MVFINDRPNSYTSDETLTVHTSLIHLLDSIYHAADNGLATLLLSLDLSAAFNIIDHTILFNCLTSSFRHHGFLSQLA